MSAQLGALAGTAQNAWVWRNRALWLSLALNVFLAALVGSHLLLGRPAHTPGLDGAVERLSRDLPPRDADRFRTIMTHERPWYEMAHSRMEAARADLSRSIAQAPYDEHLVRERLHEWQARWQEMSERFADSMLLAIASLSPEGRAHLADAAGHVPRR